MNTVKKIRLYIKEPLVQNELLTLSEHHSHYLVNVMRLQAGDAIRFFNERDGEYKGVIIKAHKKKTEIEIAEKLSSPRLCKEIHLYLPPLKKQALSYAVEKATECGATHIHFIQTEYTDHTKINLERLKATAIEACEQCRRFDVPEIYDVMSLDKILSHWPDNQDLYLAAEDGRGSLLSTLPESKNIPALMIGPEGGFSEAEFEKLAAFPKTTFMSLGVNILRAETAAVVGLSQILLT